MDLKSFDSFQVSAIQNIQILPPSMILNKKTAENFINSRSEGAWPTDNRTQSEGTGHGRVGYGVRV